VNGEWYNSKHRRYRLAFSHWVASDLRTARVVPGGAAGARMRARALGARSALAVGACTAAQLALQAKLPARLAGALTLRVLLPATAARVLEDAMRWALGGLFLCVTLCACVPACGVLFSR